LAPTIAVSDQASKNAWPRGHRSETLQFNLCPEKNRTLGRTSVQCRSGIRDWRICGQGSKLLVHYCRRTSGRVSALREAGCGGIYSRSARSGIQAITTANHRQVSVVNLPEPNRSGYGLTADKMKECVWAKPERRCELEFVERTQSGRLRHAVFRRLVS